MSIRDMHVNQRDHVACSFNCLIKTKGILEVHAVRYAVEVVVLLARRSGSEALMLRASRLSHVSVRTCVLWQNG